jgi:hypothetical protein
LVEDEIDIVVKLAGKTRGRIRVAASDQEGGLRARAPAQHRRGLSIAV